MLKTKSSDIQLGDQADSRNLSESGDEIDWDAYATQYDLMAKYNPSYRENIELLRDYLGGKKFEIGGEPRILDLGAGTGNYISALSRDFRSARFVHVDFDKAMNEVAKTKYRDQQIQHVEIIEKKMEELSFESESFDVIICVNALYAVAPRKEVLHNIYNWLAPKGLFFIIDFGREFRALDWAWYVLKSVVKNHGIVECTRFIANSAEIYRQNARGGKSQRSGSYWLHSTMEFGEVLTETGFRIQELHPCYRDYCDLALCTK